MAHDKKPHNTPETQSRPDKITEAAVSTSNMVHGFALSAIISGYILGPLLLLGGGTWWLYKAGYVSKFVVVGMVVVAFIISNALIISKSKKLITGFNKKTGIKDPTPEEAARWREKNGPYDDEEEN